MQPRWQPEADRSHKAFSSLPIELFLHVLDQLVATRDGTRPIAHAPSDSIGKTLRALAQVSRDIYPVASRYLYAYCLYLGTCTGYARFRRTLGLHLGSHPQALGYGQAGRNEKLFLEADILRHISSVFISPYVEEVEGDIPPRVRLPQVIDLFNTIGPTLRRLVMDLEPIYAPASEVERIKPHISTNNVFGSMVSLEELVCSYDTTDYFPYPPPNLKRLAITQAGMDDPLLRFTSSIPKLQTVFILRNPDMDAMDIEQILTEAPPRTTSPYSTPLDIVLVSVYANHRTPEATRDWTPEDTVRFWEIDVPKGYYEDVDDDMILCDSWIWEHAVRGTLFKQEKRRMKSWNQIQKELEAIDVATTASTAALALTSSNATTEA